MKKLIFTTLLLAGVAASFSVKAQPLTVGTVVNDIKLKTTHGDSVSLYSYLDQGYTVLVDISATWCGPCWSFKQTNVAEDLYKHYGPAGTITPKKVMVWFIEGDKDTGPADLAGTTSASQGDWVTGIDYPIIDYTNYTPVIHFLQPGATSISYPTFLLICPNRKVIYNAEGFSPSMNEAFFVAKMGTCGAGTGIEETFNTSSLTLSPNPASNTLHVNMEVLAKTNATLSITNIVGQVISRQQITLQAGEHTQSMDIANLPAGMYVLSVSTEKGTLQHKFVKK
jgi:thiol-disulfide isomerase/thioredoxin